MKVLLINGSQRKNGNTYLALEHISKELNKEGIETEIYYLGPNNLRGCGDCLACLKLQNKTCGLKDGDIVNDGIKKMVEADGVIFGSPVHFAGMAPGLKAFLDRAFYVSTTNGGLFNNMPAASIVAVRRGGGTAALDQINKYIAYNEMFQVHSNYWPAVHGLKAGDINEDKEGLQILEVIAKNMAYLVKVLDSSTIEKPKRTKKVMTNFVR